MCIEPCSTCYANNFYSCTTCPDDTYTLVHDTLCIIRPTYYLQLATTCLLLIFILPPLLRKRAVVLIRILDYVQMIALFKLIKGHSDMRSTWLYFGLRGWGSWEEGWAIISEGKTVNIWVNDEGVIDKTIRVGSFWALFTVFGIVLGIIRSALDEKNMTFEKYMSKNIGNIISIAFYYTLQDTSLIVATSLLSPSLDSKWDYISVGLGIFFALGILLMMVWSFSIINFPSQTQKYHQYKYFFLNSMDYHLFPTYSLLDLPKSSLQIKKYSNLRLLDMVKKIGFSFLIVAYLTPTYAHASTQDQIYQVAAYLVFFQLLFLLVMPFNIKKEYLQLTILIIAFGCTIFLLYAPWEITNSTMLLFFVFFIFGLALLSLILEYCLAIYHIVPVDLYETGMKVVVEDPALLKEIAHRKREQEEMERKLREMEERNNMLEKRAREKENKVVTPKGKSQSSSQKELQIHTEEEKRNDSEASLAVGKNMKEGRNMELEMKGEQLLEKSSMNSEEVAELYRIDDLKRRKVYQWDRQQAFQYSNKMD